MTWRLRVKHLRTGHTWEFVRNIYGDEINYCGGYRSIYQCACGARKYCSGLSQMQITMTDPVVIDESKEMKPEDWLNIMDYFKEKNG